MPSIVREISEWGSTLPYWEQAALEKIVAGVAITDDILDELLQYLLEDADLAPRTATRPVLRFSLEAADDEDGEQHNKVRLKSVFNLCNINALIPNQLLEFGPQLTTIFGSNGSGKSGYARVIASASFTRGDKQILRDVTKPANTDEPLSADIQLEIEGRSLTIHHEIGQVCQEMHSFYVFDSTSVRAHLTRSNPMSFAPAGLEYLTRLAEVTDSVRKRLQQRVDQLNCTNSFSTLFASGDTVVAQAINNLGSKTDIALVQRLATLSTEEIDHIAELDLHIAQLKSTNIPEQIAELDQTIADLNLLANALKRLDEELSDSQINGILKSIRVWTGLNEAAQSFSIEQFESPVFKKVGSEVWYEFIKAAYALAAAEATTENTYPEESSSCLLCHQPLDSDALELLKRLWAFLTSDIQARLDQEEKILDISAQALLILKFDLLDDQAVSYRHLQEQDPQSLLKAQQFIQACLLRRNNLVADIQNRTWVEVTPLPDDGVRDIDHVIGRLLAQRDELAKRKVAEEIQRLEQEKLELDHRKLLAEVLEEVVQFIENARWIEVASSGKVKRSTAPISKKYNDLFDRLVTQEYIRLFQDTLVKLNCPLQVQITTRAQKGTTIKQITLQTDASIAPEQAPPDKVLSEGEQRAVALADFFTEVRLDKQSCGVILDDPVTSLDFEWKETIAQYVIEEAGRQQVIVFTHDLHFLSLLCDFAEEKVNVVAHWVQRKDNIPGWVFIGNSPIAEKEYRKSTKAKEYLAKAKDVGRTNAEEEQMYLENGFGALRTTYEVFVMHELFQDVVLRFQERVSGDRLKNVYVDEGIRDEVSSAMGRLSRHITAHSHSDFHAAQKPTTEMLEREIAGFDDIVQRHKKIRKDRGLDQ